MNTTNEHAVHRPGAVSLFLIAQAAMVAAGCWAWLGVLAGTGAPPSGWHFVAAAGAITATLGAVALGVRYALQRDAALRHEQVMRTLVEISWHSFAQAAREMSAREAGLPDLSTVDNDVVVRLAPESRRRPRA